MDRFCFINGNDGTGCEVEDPQGEYVRHYDVEELQLKYEMAVELIGELRDESNKWEEMYRCLVDRSNLEKG
jgi:hypothetical protein